MEAINLSSGEAIGETVGPFIGYVFVGFVIFSFIKRLAEEGGNVIV